MQRRTIFIFLGALLVTAAVGVTAFVFLWRTAKQAVTETILAPQEKTIDVATLVTQVRELNRLETASMHVVHIGTITQTYKMVPSSLGGDEITFLATGDVIAGIDLSQLQQNDVWRSPDGTINVRLPRSQILVSRVDNEQSRVLTRKTGVLRRADVDLETRARQHAETNIRAEAIKKGLLTLASQNAEKKLAELLHTFGAEKVRFIGGAVEAAPAER
jgi:hypothetical protein